MSPEKENFLLQILLVIFGILVIIAAAVLIFIIFPQYMDPEAGAQAIINCSNTPGCYAR